ncbi:MAG: hypothetical protein JXB15_03900, partial [Anaerolineales bacterium]|nr:hypothetical protein [Anaerolineales bacterium]
DVQVGGAPAVIYVDHNGAWPSRQALIISRGWGYTILAQPYGPDQWPAGLEDLERAWDTALDSIAFFTPWR